MSYPDAIQNAQRVLRAHAGYAAGIDGDPGLQSLISARTVGFDFPKHWPPARIVIGAAQVLLRRNSEDPGPIDGFWGPSTDAAFEIWRLAGRGTPFARPHDLPEPHAPARWPSEADLEEWFGPPGGHACTAGRVRVPWRMVLAWDPKVQISHITCHADVATSLGRVLQEIADTHAPDQIRDLGLHLFGGCFNDRPKRGGASKSTHAWGIALDLDPARNRLTQHAPAARLSHPDATGVWQAFEAEGWLSLGRARDFDWMHVQAAGL